jgi:hypothetical protein
VHCFDHVEHLAHLAARSRDEDVIAILPRRDVDAADDLGEELAVHARQHDAHGLAAADAERARRDVGNVAHRLCNGQHVAGGLLAHDLLAVENARHRGHGNAGASSDVVNRRG